MNDTQILELTESILGSVENTVSKYEYAPPILSDDDNGEYKKYETEETYRYIVSGKGYYDAETGKGFALSGYSQKNGD